MDSVKTLNIDHIASAPGPFSSPGETVPISFFDAFWVNVPAVQILLLYPNSSNPDIPALKSSFSKTLLNFHSLSGKITYIPKTSDVVIDCRRQVNEGVKFIEAECKNLSIFNLAKDQIHNADVFEKLVPVIGIDILPTATMAIQLTKFAKGGLAMGITFHHMAVDGKGMWEFINTWSRCSKGEMIDNGGSLILNDRALVNCRRGSEVAARNFVKQMSPYFPNAKRISTSQQQQPQATRRTLHISTAAIEKIRQNIMNEATKSKSFNTPPSKFVILTAIIWVCFAKAKAISDERNSIMFIPVDTRSILEPSIPESYTYIGNCVKPLYANLKVSKLLSGNGAVEACMEIRKTINEGMKEPLKGYEEWAEEAMKVPDSLTLRISNSPKFRAYDLSDFGWGKPERVEIVSLSRDGWVNYFYGKEDGQVQVSVVLSPPCMDRFVEEFEKFSTVGMKSSLSILSRI